MGSDYNESDDTVDAQKNKPARFLMMKATAKGGVQVRAKNGTVRLHPRSRMAGILQSQSRRAAKQRAQQFREFKEQLRAAKTAVPLEYRAKVNWSEVQKAAAQA